MISTQEAPMPPVRRPYSIEKATTHIQSNIIQKTSRSMEGRKCGDGRDGQEFIEAIFGSDLGYGFAAQAALRDMGKVVPGKEAEALQSTLALVAGESGKTYVHTDNHQGNEGQLYGGCGANRVARENMLGFGLIPDDFTALDGVMKNLDEQGKVEKAVYKGNHIEGAVVLVKGRDFGIKANDQKENTSVFVATVDLIEDRLRLIARSLAPEYGVEENTLYDKIHIRWAAQTEIIRLNLAKIGENLLPVFTAEFSSTGEPKLTAV